MNTLSYTQIQKIYKGLEYSFKKRDSKLSRSENLNTQISVRNNMKSFIEDESNETNTFEISKEDGELIVKKFEYTFKRKEQTQLLIEALTS